MRCLIIYMSHEATYFSSQSSSRPIKKSITSHNYHAQIIHSLALLLRFLLHPLTQRHILAAVSSEIRGSHEGRS